MTDQQEKQQALRFFRQLVRVRIFEERVSELFVQGGTAGSMLHLSIGEEAGAVGVMGAMREGDGFTTHHRGHGIFLARGADPKKMMAEIAGKSTGYCRGKGGSMHIADRGLGHLGANAIVGGGISHVVGAGLTYQMKHHGNAAVAFFGDGAIHNGAFHEAAGLAQLWNIPMLFVCENNGYAEATATDWHLNTDKLSDISKAYNMKSYQEDGNDVFKVYEITKQAIKESKEKSIPIFLELINYRFSGQYEGDTQLYQPQEEIEKAKENDPIKLALENCNKNGLEFSEVEKIKNDAMFEVDEAFKYAETQPWPDPEDALEEVYVNYPRESL